MEKRRKRERKYEQSVKNGGFVESFWRANFGLIFSAVIMLLLSEYII